MHSTMQQTHRCIYIDNSSIWWDAETVGHPSEGDIRPIEHYPEELQITLEQVWSEVTCTIGELRRIILYFEEDGSKHFATFGRRQLLV